MNKLKEGSVSTGSDLPHISLPKGGGAIRNMGEKFQSNPVTGTASFTLPVKISHSRNNFQPGISLSYDSGNGNGVFGLGWNAGVNSIKRKTQKGLPKYNDGQESDVFLLAGVDDLVPFLEFRNNKWQRKLIENEHYTIFSYRTRTEGTFSRIERWTDNVSGISHWIIKTKENITSIFGASVQSRIVSPENDRFVFEWLLEKTFDDKGNCIVYEYKQEDDSGINHATACEQNRNNIFSNRYLKRIRYGNTLPAERLEGRLSRENTWMFELLLDYGEHPGSVPGYDEQQNWLCRQDPHSDYHAGFEIRTYRLCSRFLMFHRVKELGEEPYLVASTQLEFEESPAHSFLKSVQYVSYERGKEPAPFPPLNFHYSKPQLSSPEFFEMDENDAIFNKIDFSKTQWSDLYGEGMTGLLYGDDSSWWYKRNVSDNQNQSVRFNSFRKIAEHPSLAGNISGYQLTDIDGDGNPEVVVHSNGIAGFFEQDDLQWKNFKSFPDNPNINWKDPNLRMIDLTGDGRADILITEERCFTWYESKAKEGYGEAQRHAIPFDETCGADLVFNDGSQSIYLADMSGDGLTDIVRIRNGEVCYWPNLGYGKFGNKITFDQAPRFDHPGLFDQNRIRLADIDGSGTTDILYIAENKITYWTNQAGNSFSEERVISDQIYNDNVAQIQALDLFGKGTSCLVMTNPVTGKLKYIDLMVSGKPHLLTDVDNNMGAISRFHYAASTKFYLEDEKNGTPWITKLPFPVQVVEKTEVIDQVDSARFATRYAYHHGYYDGVEREFRGFGMVEQWDTESYADQLRLDENAVEEEMYSPPVYTKTWFHTGFFFDKNKIPGQYLEEYYSGDDQVWELTEFIFPAELKANEWREAARACKGSQLRQEVYALDGTDKENHPYTVTSHNYEVRQLQPGEKNKESVFHVIPLETLTYHYERNAADPRIGHQVNLETDEFGHVLQSITIAYPRRIPEFTEQNQLLVRLTDHKFIHCADQRDWYRLGIACKTEEWEISGFSFAGKMPGVESIKALLASAVVIPYENEALPGEPTKRELGEQRIYYYSENANDILPFGEMAFHALPFYSRKKALTPSLVQKKYGNKPDDSTLLAAGYLMKENVWWAPSTRLVFDPLNFYLPVQSIDPLNNTSSIEYDSYYLFPVKSTDAAGNVTGAQYDYRVLQTSKTTDANGNQHFVSFDTHGSVIFSAVTGKNDDGDTLENPTARLEYELFNWSNNGKPNFVKTFARERHKDENTPWQISYSYSNGLGKEILKKVQAEDGEAFARNTDGILKKDSNGILLRETTSSRWVGSGRVILNNKGKPVKQYEPYFSGTPDYEDEQELREYGVTPLIHYDPPGRVIRTDLPDGTYTKVEFDAWKKSNFDANDTVLESDWYKQRGAPDRSGPSPSAPDQRAAWLSAKHANTPQVIYFDSLAREFMTMEDNGEFGKYITRIEFDSEGNQRSVTDAKGRIIAQYEYDLLNNRIYTWTADSGERWIFYSLFSEEAKDEEKKPISLPLISWDNRGFRKQVSYDALHRPVEIWLSENEMPAQLIEWILYGERHLQPLPLNLRGKTWLHFDQSGLSRNCFYDFKGNALETCFQPAQEYKTFIDWQSLLQISPEELENKAAALLEAETFTSFHSYDALNRTVSTTHPDGSEEKFLFNKAGLPEKQTACLSGEAGWTEFVHNIDYDEKGQRIAIWYGNGTKTNYRYDEKNFRLVRLFTVRLSDNVFLQDLNYTYDPSGNITEINDAARQTVFFNNTEVEARCRYEYDALYRLVKASGRELAGQMQTGVDDCPMQSLPQPGDTFALRNYSQAYRFDETGNILSIAHTAKGGSWKRNYRYKTENNHLLETSRSGDAEEGPYSDKYAHDAHGNMTAMPHLQNITWNFHDRMQYVDLGGGGMAYYVYNTGGRRTRKVIERLDGSIAERFYLGNFEVHRERRKNIVELDRKTLFIGDDKHRVAQADMLTIENSIPKQQRNIRYRFSNHLGSATLELDEEAALISYEEYHPFGTSAYRSGRNETEVSLKRYRYSGKERDEETGLYYYGARHLITWLGRWSSADPAGFVDGLNMFVFVKGNPIRFNDPNGQKAEEKKEEGQGNLNAFELQVAKALFKKNFKESNEPRLEIISIITGDFSKKDGINYKGPREGTKGELLLKLTMPDGRAYYHINKEVKWARWLTDKTKGGRPSSETEENQFHQIEIAKKKDGTERDKYVFIEGAKNPTWRLNITGTKEGEGNIYAHAGNLSENCHVLGYSLAAEIFLKQIDIARGDKKFKGLQHRVIDNRESWWKSFGNWSDKKSVDEKEKKTDKAKIIKYQEENYWRSFQGSYYR